MRNTAAAIPPRLLLPLRLHIRARGGYTAFSKIVGIDRARLSKGCRGKIEFMSREWRAIYKAIGILDDVHRAIADVIWEAWSKIESGA